MVDVIERFNEILKHTGHTYNSFSKEIGLKRSQNLYDIRDGKVKKISFGLATLIVDRYPEINKDWILTGEGYMLHHGNKLHTTADPADFYKTLPMPGNDKVVPTANKEKVGVPYYDIDFMGGFDLVFNSQQVQPSFYIDFLPFNDCDCWINVTGKSMGPLIAHGDIVGLKKVNDWRRFLLEGEIYAIITDNGFRTIKMLGAGPDKSTYTLIPYNKSEEYKPQVIPKEVITHIFRVKGNIKKFF